jgi:transposase
LFQTCDLMLHYNDDLRRAHMLKEWFYSICQNPKYSVQITEFYEWIRNAESCGIEEFEKCASTYRHWSKEILNAFKYNLGAILYESNFDVSLYYFALTLRCRTNSFY